MESYEQYIFKSKYARWQDDKQRRETWEEAVDRYFAFFVKHLREKYDYALSPKDLDMVRHYVLTKQVMPSMRAFMSAGLALERDNPAGYNCAYLAVRRTKAFAEAMYLLMCGCGVGFSVERQYIAHLPIVPPLVTSEHTIIVEDSRLGWANAFQELITCLYDGKLPSWDTTLVRPKGTPLKTFGGQASGPEPLENLFRFVVQIFKSATERRLESLECHDIMCVIADSVISGGIRRSAMISLSNRSDDRMRSAKTGDWNTANPQRSFANNSIAYTERPSEGEFMREWLSLYESKSGERGIFNRRAADKKIASLGTRKTHAPDGTPYRWGCNPCSEVILRDMQFCNLSEVVLTATDTIETIAEKVSCAAMLGTMQSTLTDFVFLDPEWKKNCEEERLLGVSLTGIMDCPLISKSRDPALLGCIRGLAKRINERLARQIGINPAAAITCVKPSGTVSQLVGCSSGIHPRHSKYYIRRVRESAHTPIAKFLKAKGVPWEDSHTKPGIECIFSFPVAAPTAAITREDVNALEMLELSQFINEHWCDHKVSVTIDVKDGDWMNVGAYVWNNFDKISGVSFFPYSDHIYMQAPFESITEATYKKLVAKFPAIEWEDLNQYDVERMAPGSQEFACVGHSCEY